MNNNRMDIESQDKLFQPSHWSKRYSTPDQVISEHITFTKNESERVRSSIPYETVRYGEIFEHETFDIYGIHLSKDAPIFIYIHGGYWQDPIDKSISAYIVQPLVDAGHKVIVLDYDLCPNISLEQLVNQIQRAGIFIVNYATSMGTKGIQLVGHSAGAHLAVCLFDGLIQKGFTFESIVKSLYLFGGVYDLREPRFMPSINPNNKILSLDDANTSKLSPICFDYRKWTEIQKDIAIYLFVGTNDAPKLIEQSHQFDELLSANHTLKHKLFILDGYDHFDAVEDLSKTNYFITRMLIDEAKHF